MDHEYFLLKTIQKRWGLYLVAKSLDLLRAFLHGYTIREAIEIWTKKSGLSFVDHYEEFTQTTIRADYDSCLDGFPKYVFSHYNVGLTSSDYFGIIIQNTSSQAEAFDKYFELLDEYMERYAIQPEEEH